MSRNVKIALGAIVALVLIVLGLLWLGGYPPFDNTPEEVSIEAAQQAVEDAADETGDEADEESAPTTAAGVESLDGTWTVVENPDATFVGYRINEVLNTVGDFTVVARTPDVTGTLTGEGTTVTAVDIVADMTTLTTDSSGRDNAMRSQALETNDFPEATFVLTAPIELGSMPAEGETISAVATGDLTVHGVTQAVEFPLEAVITGGSFVVIGQLEVALADFDISPPTARVVASVEDVAILELSLVFSRG